jgi:hypothetical protein
MSAPFPVWLADLGVTQNDLLAFGPDLRLEGDILLACHRDGGAVPLGWERVSAGAHGHLRCDYPKGLAKGCLASTPLSGVAGRVLVTCGAVPALCAAAVDRLRSDTVYVGLCGGWTDTAAQALARLVSGGADEVVIAFADTACGRRSRAAAEQYLRTAHMPARRLVARQPALGSWPVTLRRLRGTADRKLALQHQLIDELEANMLDEVRHQCGADDATEASG